MLPVRCRGCRRLLGVATDTHNGVYCDEKCTQLPPASKHDWRDDIIVLLDRALVDRQTIASHFSITKQRVSQIVLRAA